ncbi:hypothetical protein D9757_002845 [Collybiopsis confluens]|uniref:Endonuclease/exonuclease/phosphatase domain-containing protein n=1 Tax=Collybiopsis confluens TaxID=2823264 RepID=A0A8H5MDP0_9AGAR|nr:hypothetical protein D9757_002845 [Collybiopsis confluens]
MASKKPSLTPDQLALQEARKVKKAKQNAEASSPPPSLVDIEKGQIIERKWIQIKNHEELTGHRARILTWNLLAQCLVRRELFPNSDCLKATQREHMLYREILLQNADIICLQEVDRLEKLLPVLADAGYTSRFASAPGKKHGCLIAFKDYIEVGARLISYDDEKVRGDGEGVNPRGSSFRTRNIGHVLALKHSRSGKGIIVATTHLFWHPKYLYEKTRQAAILKREVVQFKSNLGLEDWPCILCGDFNFCPDDPAYSLMVGDSLLPAQEEKLCSSYVVHATIDPSIALGATSQSDDNEEDADPDKVITNARSAQPVDGLLSISELHSLFSQSAVSLKSAYDSGLRHLSDGEKPMRTFGDRVPIGNDRCGAHEPEWSSYTYYWKLVLADYIFILDAPGRHSVVTGVLSGHCTEDIEPGLPKLGVCGSDHVALCADVVFVETVG